MKLKQKGFASLITCLLAGMLSLISFITIKYGIMSKNIFHEKQILDSCGIGLGKTIISTNDVTNICNEIFLNRCAGLLESPDPDFLCEDLGLECNLNEDCKRSFKVTSTYNPGIRSTEKSVKIKVNEEIHDVEKIDAAVIFLLDYSGSMRGNRILQLKSAINQFIASNYNLNYSVILYNSDTIETSNISKGLNHDNLVESIVDNNNAGGGTNFARPLQNALQLINSTDHEAYYIVLVSDGSPNEGLGESLSIVNNNIRSIDDNYCVYSTSLNPCITIFSLGVDNANMSILNNLSGNTLSQDPNRYSFNITANQTSDAFKAIIEEIMCRIGPVFSSEDLNVFNGLQKLEENIDYIYDRQNKIIKFYDVEPFNICTQIINNDNDITIRWGKPSIDIIN